MSRVENAVVVGTGFGGAVTACRLSQAGFAPLVLERGRRYGKSDFPAQPNPASLLPDLRRWTWQNEQGLWDIEDLEEVVAVTAAGYGGGSLIYANVHLRPPDEVFADPRWPARYRDPTFLEPYFNLAGWMLDVRPVKDAKGHVALECGLPAKAVRLEDLDRRRRAAAGESAPRLFYPPLAVNFETEGANRFGRTQAKCVSCGACCTGCPHAAKNTLDFNYLAVAENRGAKIRTQCEVIGIEQDATNGRWHVDYIDHLSAQKVRVETMYLFLCAGSIHTTRLLAAWQTGLPHHSRDHALIARLGFGYFPNADAIGVAFDTKDELYPSWGPTIVTATVHTPKARSASCADSWFLIEDGGYASQLDRLLSVLRAPAWGRRNFYKEGPLAIQSPPPLQLPYKPPPSALPVPANPGFLRSPLDGLLDAYAQKKDSIFHRAVPEQLTNHIRPLLREMGRPLMPSIVRQTVSNVVARRLRTFLLTRCIPPDSRLFRWLAGAWTWLGLWVLGGSKLTGDDAVDAIVALGGLNRDRAAARLFEYSDAGRERRLMLLAMGRDERPGRLHYDAYAGKMYADLDLFHAAPLYMDEELAMRDVARDLAGELRVNPAWSFLGKPITVHSQGGCRMADDKKSGVTTPDGMVHGYPGLYVMDGALICRSVGVNPSATIAAIVERNIDVFLTAHARNIGGARWPAEEYSRQRELAGAWFAEASAAGWALKPPSQPRTQPESEPLGLAFTEMMTGFCQPTTVDPMFVDATYRELENQGRPDYPVTVTLNASVVNLAAFFEDLTHSLDLEGEIVLKVPGARQPHKEQRLRVKGRLRLMVASPGPSRDRSVEDRAPRSPRHPRLREKGYGLDPNDPEQADTIAAHEQIFGVPYTTTVEGHPAIAYRAMTMRREGGRLAAAKIDLPRLPSVAKAAPLPRVEERFMDYELSFADEDAQRWSLTGYKRLRDVADFDAWRDTTWLFTRLKDAHGNVQAAGVLHVTLPGFIEQLKSIHVFCGDPKGVADVDPARAAWHVATFATFFFGNLQRIYWPGLGSVIDTLWRPPKHRPVR